MPPLLFFQGGYGRFSALSLLSGSGDDSTAHLRLANRARPYIESLAETFGVECHASALIGDQLIQLVYAGAGGADQGFNKVGMHLPFVPPMGSLFAAWAGAEVTDAWLARSSPEVSPKVRAGFEHHLQQIRAQGWASTPDDDRLYAMESVVSRMATNGDLPARQRELHALLGSVAVDYAGLGNPSGEPSVHSISAPVFNASGDVVLAMTLHERHRRQGAPRGEYQAGLLEAAARVTQEIGGAAPR